MRFITNQYSLGKILYDHPLPDEWCTNHQTSVCVHYSYVIMDAMASKITGVSIVYSSFCSGADQGKHQSSASLAFVRVIHQSPVNSPHKGAVRRKMLPFDDVIIFTPVSLRSYFSIELTNAATKLAQIRIIFNRDIYSVYSIPRTIGFVISLWIYYSLLVPLLQIIISFRIQHNKPRTFGEL